MTEAPEPVHATAFAGGRLIASGALADVARIAIASADGSVLVFDDRTGRVLDVDASMVNPQPMPARRPGRPKLGVVAREVTLLPRHWDWLSRQPGGASVALRKLVDEARRSHAAENARREAREACYAFMSAIAGDEPGFEEATRALFAGDRDRFAAESGPWPHDVAKHALRLAEPAFEIAKS
jgi:uncharacterized protein